MTYLKILDAYEDCIYIYYYFQILEGSHTAFIYCDNLGFRDIINFLKYYKPFNLYVFLFRFLYCK